MTINCYGNVFLHYQKGDGIHGWHLTNSLPGIDSWKSKYHIKTSIKCCFMMVKSKGKNGNFDWFHGYVSYHLKIMTFENCQANGKNWERLIKIVVQSTVATFAQIFLPKLWWRSRKRKNIGFISSKSLINKNTKW